MFGGFIVTYEYSFHLTVYPFISSSSRCHYLIEALEDATLK